MSHFGKATLVTVFNYSMVTGLQNVHWYISISFSPQGRGHYQRPICDKLKWICRDWLIELE